MTERKIALYDIDKTSYKDFLLLDIVRYQFRKGILPALNLLAMEKDIDLYTKGELTYKEMARSVLESWPKGLKGEQIEEVIHTTKEFFQAEGKKFLPFVQETIYLLSPTHDIYFVTAEPQFVAEEVVRLHQATGYCSTVFEVKSGVFTGNVSSSLSTKEDKGNAIRVLMQDYSKKQSFAFGDSDNDVEMLEGVEYSICVNPNDALKKIATEKGWQIKKPEEIVVFIRGIIQPTTKT